MSNKSLEEKNKKVRERMLNFTEIRFDLSYDLSLLRPVRMHFIQDGKQKDWDLMRIDSSVIIVVYNISRKKLVFVRRFQPAAYFACLPEKQELVDLKKYPVELGLTIELCSGIVKKDKSLVEIAQDTLRKKCEYEAPISAFQKIITFRFIGSSAAKQTLFYVEVTDDMHMHCGGRAEEEDELIEIVEMSVEEAKKYINSEEVQSSPCLLHGVSWFLINEKDK